MSRYRWNEVAQTVSDCTWSILPCWLRVRAHRQSIPIKNTAGKPSIRSPASREIISASMMLCETAVCFSQVNESGTYVSLPNLHKTPPDVDFRILQISRNRRVLEQTPLATVNLITSMTELLIVHRDVIMTNQPCQSLVASSVPFYDILASV